MALSDITATLPEAGGDALFVAVVVGAYLVTNPKVIAHRRARRARTAAFRLRRRRNFWRYLLGWGELPRGGTIEIPAARPGDLLILAIGGRTLLRTVPELDVDRITQEA